MKLHSLRFILASLPLLLSGCGAMVLSEKEGYGAEIDRLRAEVVAGTQQAYTGGEQNDADAYHAGLNRVLNACDDADRLVTYGEAAVKSFYGQQSSYSALVALERRAYAQDCEVDGLNRLREATIELQDSAKVLREVCGCPFSGSNNDVPDVDNYVTLGSCSLDHRQEAWEHYWEDDERAIYTSFSTGLLAFPTGGIAPLFIAAGLLGGIASNAHDLQGYCEAVHTSYTREYRNIPGLKERCGTPPPAADGRGAPTAADLDERINNALEWARSGAGSEYDGSSIYGNAYALQTQCRELTAALGPNPAEPLMADEDPLETIVDQDVSAMGEYTIPEDPERPYTPPGGG